MLKKTVSSALVLCLTAILSSSNATPVLWSANGHQYDVIYQNSISWANSRAAAQALGSGWDLATITSIDEQNFITALLGPANVNTLNEFYIGGLYLNGAWTWVTGEAFGFTYWGADEPNGNSAEPRLALDSRYRQGNWGWNDYTGAGSSFVLGFVAESAAAVPEPGIIGMLGLGLAGLICGLRRRNG